MAVGAYDGGGGGQLQLCRAVGDHVAPGHQGELGGGEETEARDELVGRCGPRGGRTVAAQPGATGEDQDDPALAGRDQRGGIDDGGDAEAIGAPHARPEPELEHRVGGGLTHHAVDVAGVDPGVGESTERRLERDRRRVVPRETARLVRVEDADDGDVAERMRHRVQDVTRPAGAGGSAAPCHWP
jgi:hypothetical protein